jgi:hypothetical protein
LLLKFFRSKCDFFCTKGLKCKKNSAVHRCPGPGWSCAAQHRSLSCSRSSSPPVTPFTARRQRLLHPYADAVRAQLIAYSPSSSQQQPHSRCHCLSTRPCNCKLVALPLLRQEEIEWATQNAIWLLPLQNYGAVTERSLGADICINYAID